MGGPGFFCWGKALAVLTIPAYCTQAEVKRLFSTSGVNARLDDVCELQKVAITGTPTGGTYTLTYGGNTTAAIVYNGDALAVQTALRELSGLEECEVLTTGTTPNFVHRVKFVSVTGSAALLTASNSMTGGTPVLTIGEMQAGSSQALDDAIIEACEEINKFAYRFYTPANLGYSNLVNRWCARLACYFLSSRRGNPKLFRQDYEDILDELKQVMAGDMPLPGIPMRRALAPVMSNQRADPHYIFKVLRVEPNTSTGTPTTRTQDIDYFSAAVCEW